jgi:hypothetical protein
MWVLLRPSAPVLEAWHLAERDGGGLVAGRARRCRLRGSVLFLLGPARFAARSFSASRTTWCDFGKVRLSRMSFCPRFGAVGCFWTVGLARVLVRAPTTMCCGDPQSDDRRAFGAQGLVSGAFRRCLAVCHGDVVKGLYGIYGLYRYTGPSRTNGAHHSLDTRSRSVFADLRHVDGHSIPAARHRRLCGPGCFRAARRCTLRRTPPLGPDRCEPPDPHPLQGAGRQGLTPSRRLGTQAKKEGVTAGYKPAYRPDMADQLKDAAGHRGGDLPARYRPGEVPDLNPR